MYRQQRAPRDHRQPAHPFLSFPQLVRPTYSGNSGPDLGITLTPSDVEWIVKDIVPLRLLRTGQLPASQVVTPSHITLTYPVDLIANDQFDLPDVTTAITNSRYAVLAPCRIAIPPTIVEVPEFTWVPSKTSPTTVTVLSGAPSVTIYARFPAAWVSQPSGTTPNAQSSIAGTPGIALTFLSDLSADTHLQFAETRWSAWSDDGKLIIPATEAYV